ncbi:MAG: tripartite tricarboxylate transporter substrate binding protein [Burkholderiales bacterium]|nr:tripartite tricarboxylate transporter substrate binding protein [Burkholderiales bacterium]
MIRRVAIFAMASLFAAGTCLAQPGWKPEHNVEFMTGTAAGGALDRNARLIQNVIQQRGWMNVPFTVINKSGGGGAVSWAYMNLRPGDGHYLSLASILLMTNKITGANPITYTDLTPIVHLMSEYQAMAVRADSPFKTGKELIDRLRTDPASVTFGLGTPRGGSSHISISIVAKAAGIDARKLRFAVFKSGGEAAVALLGGHVDVVASSANNYVRHVESGRLRILGVAAPQRLGDGFANAPTWREQGVDAVFENWRGIYGPRGLSPEQVAYWEDIFAKVVETDEWKQELRRNLSVPTFMRHKEMSAFLKTNYQQFHEILSELGYAK